MKLERRLYIGGTEYPIIKQDCTLELSSIGRAVFTVRSETKPAGIVSFQAGYTSGRMHSVFLGVIKDVEAKDRHSWVISCRQLAESLRLPCPVSLRNCTFADVASDISKTIAFDLSIDNSASYANTPIPRFANTTDALTAVQNLGRTFNIPEFCWYQLPDGQLWLGNHADGQYAKQGNISIADSLFTKHKPGGLSTIPALPALRPGMIVNNKRVDIIRLIEMETLIKWSS